MSTSPVSSPANAVRVPISCTSTLMSNFSSIPYLMILAAACPDGQLGIATTRSAAKAAAHVIAKKDAENAIRQIQIVLGMIAPRTRSHASSLVLILPEGGKPISAAGYNHPLSSNPQCPAGGYTFTASMQIQPGVILKRYCYEAGLGAT